MEQNVTDNFIVDRNNRFKIIKEKQLIGMLCDRVKINNKPISSKTVTNTFKVVKFEDLKGAKLRVWLASKEIIDSLVEDTELYT